MKLKKLRQGTGILLLAVTMTVMMTISQFGTLVHAAELPDKTQFATADELKTFNTDSTDGIDDSALVYFGDDGYGGDQWWWIVGSQGGDTMVLWPYEPRSDNGPGGMEVNFFPKEVDPTTGVYADRFYEGKLVGMSHYGASEVRKAIQVYETNCFTSAERALMNDTTFYTEDTVNNEVYAITSKLYLGFGFKGRGYFTVGRNTADDVYAGLRVDEAYIGNAPFWLSSADRNTNSYHGVVVWSSYANLSGGIVQTLIGNGNMALMPAFEFNLSTVLFGSTASKATAEGALTARDAFTLRYAADNLGSAVVSMDKNQVSLKDVPAGTYLVAQNSAGTQAVLTDGKTSVQAADMGLDSFTNCKVWLETTNSTENKTYATMATERNGYTFEVQVGQNMTVTTGNNVQTDVNGAITDVTIKANDGYYLPENYKDSVILPAGFTIVQNGNEITISGTPTDDVTIVLPDASIQTYTVTVNPGQNMTVTTGNNVQTGVDGAITDITVKANDGYYLPENYKDSVILPAGFTIVQNGNEITISGTPTSDVVIDLPDAAMIATDGTNPEQPGETPPGTMDETNPTNPDGNNMSDVPQTGDNSSFVWGLTAAFISLASILILLLLRKERQKAKHLRR